MRRPNVFRALVPGLVLLVAGLGGCSSDDAPSADAGSAPSSAPGTEPTTTVAPFAGPGDFYDVPDPLPPGDPGALIRYESFGPDVDGRAVWRVMFHSRDAQDRDVAVTGVVAVPTGAAPEGGWTTLSWGHGSSGLAPTCAPSRRQAPEIPAFGTDGIVASSDYPGLGPNGQRHAYLSGPSEGHSMIDVIRAAGQLPDVEVAPAWTAVGVSQGGHAALFAGQLAEDYAPELDLAGVVAVAPGAELDRAFPGDSPELTSFIRVLALYGLAVDHPEVRPEEFASPAVQEMAAQLDEVCLVEAGAAFLAIPLDDYWTVDPLESELGRRIARDASPGHAPTGVPIMLVQGDADILVVPARTRALFDRLCAADEVVAFEDVPGAGHDDAVTADAGRTIASWLEDRLAGEPAASACP